MLVRLLRWVYGFQVLAGGLLGVYLAVQANTDSAQPIALLLVPLGALGLPLMLQFLVIFTSMLRACSTRFNGAWWRAFWGELGAALRIFWLRQPWPARQRGVQLPPMPEPRRVPVLLVHGYLCNHRVWDDVANALRRAGHPVLAIDMEPVFASIDDYTQTIERGVRELLAVSQAPKVALVGHSMGGLAIRAWLRANGNARVVRVVTLGTPHQGTQIVRSAFTPNAGQMVWQSQWVQALQAAESPLERGLMHLAITTHDNIVFPQRAQVLSGATVAEFQAIGHLQMCLDAQVINWLLQTLQEASPQPGKEAVGLV